MNSEGWIVWHVCRSTCKRLRKMLRFAGRPGLFAFAFGPLMLLAAEDQLSSQSPAGSDEIRTELEVQGGDPTILKRRCWLETEWSRFRDGSDKVEETIGGLWGWRLNDHLDWGARLKLAYDWYLAPDHSGESDESGVGDTKLAAGVACRPGSRWRAGGGLEIRMPTAQNDLGDDVWKLQEFGAIGWDATSWLSFSPAVEYNHSIAEEDGAAPQSNLELYFPATIILPHRWSVTARYEEKIDFENNNYVTPAGKLYLSKQFERLPLGLTASIKKPFTTGNKDFQVNFVVTYFFPARRLH